MRARALLATLVVLAAGCRGAAVKPGGPVRPGMVARVGDVDIDPDLVSRVAAAKKTTARDALDAVIDDALLSEDARARHLDQSDAVVQAERATRARLTLDRLRERARAAGPPTDKEVEEASALHWQDVDCPEQRVVIHAVVMRPKSGALPEGPEIAAALARAVADARDDAEFERLANAAPHPQNVETRVERLPPFVIDGRVAERGAAGGFDATFARAAFAIPAPDGVSPVVETPFGWHVIRLIRILPPRQVPFDARRALFAAEVASQRARVERDALLRDLRARHPVMISDGAELAMSRATSSLPR